MPRHLKTFCIDQVDKQVEYKTVSTPADKCNKMSVANETISLFRYINLWLRITFSKSFECSIGMQLDKLVLPSLLSTMDINIVKSNVDKTTRNYFNESL